MATSIDSEQLKKILSLDRTSQCKLSEESISNKSETDLIDPRMRGLKIEMLNYGSM